MKMRKNGLVADVFATSRIPIPSPPCTKREVGLRYVAPLPERLVHHHHHAEAGAVVVGVAEPVADARKEDIKTGVSLPPSQYHVWSM